MLSDSGDEQKNIELHKITINEHYAKAFQYRKEREELDQLKAKLGSDVSESDLEEEDEIDSESAESEDEDGEELTPAVDVAILRTLARIRQKDPLIYESGKSIFDEEQEKLAAKTVFTAPGRNKKKESTKPVTIRRAALEAQLAPSRSPSPEPLTHAQEQVALRKETISAFHSSGVGGEDDEDDLLIPREKTQDEQEKEEEDYRAFLEREVGNLQEIIIVHDDATDVLTAGVESEGGGTGEVDERKRKKKKKKAEEHGTQRSKEEEDQEFLMNYILNRGWIDKYRDHVPTYKEITNKSGKSKASKSGPDPGFSSNDDSGEEDEANHSDSSFNSLNDAFETSYNFRFEEPGSSAIPSFPRSIPTLVRREDSRRKDARERRKQRKEGEIEKRREEVRRLKALKMREIRRKLETIGREGGLLNSKPSGRGKDKSIRWEGDEVEGERGETYDALKELDLEGDWDPEEHDQQMADLYGGVGDEEGDWEDIGEVDEDGKPIWKDDIDIGDIYMDDEGVITPASSKKDKKKKKKKKKKKGGQDEGEDVGVDIDTMDADVLTLKKELGKEEEWDGTEEMRKRKLDEYMEEIFNLDFNDMTGGLPTRFKYVPVTSQAYSLTPVEILLATDKELNEFMSIKRYAPYKNDARKWDTQRHQKLKELKQTLVERSRNGGWLVKNSHDTGMGTGTNGGGQSGDEKQKPKRRKGKKERLRARTAVAAEENGADDGTRTNVGADGGNVEMSTNNSEAKSLGDCADSKNTKKPKSLMNLDGEKEPEKSKEKSHKRKRDDLDQESHQSQYQGRGNEGDDGSRKSKKKRRRKHRKGGSEDEVAQVE